MHEYEHSPQFYRMVLAFRKADIKGYARVMLAETLFHILKNTDQTEALYGAVIPKVFQEALSEFGFNIVAASEVDLVQTEKVYDEVNHVLALCAHISASQPDVMEDMVKALVDDTHWYVWSFFQDLGEKDLKSIFDLYSPFGKGSSIVWGPQLKTMKEINRPQ